MNKRKAKLATWWGVENNKQNVKDNSQRLLNIIFDVVLALIFVWAARNMLNDIFNVGDMSIAGKIGCIIAVGIVSGVMEFLDKGAHRKKKLFKVSVPLVVAFVLFIYLFVFKGGEMILGGLEDFARDVLVKWNDYYGTRIRLSSTADGDIYSAVDFLMIILMVIFVWIGKLVRKRLVYAFIPGLVVALEVTVGYTPSKKSFLIMLVGILLVNVLEFDRPDFVKVSKESVADTLRRKYVYMVVVSGIIAIGCMCTQGLVKSSVDETLKYSSYVRELQKSMAENFSVSDLLKSISEAIWNKNRDGEIISNMPLSFDNVSVLKVHAQKYLQDKLYLKEFYGDKYVGGKWVNDGDEYENDVKEAGFNLELVQQVMAAMGKESVENYLAFESLDTPYILNLRLEYLKKNTKAAYVPYFAEIDASVDIHGGVYYTKDKELSEISYRVWQNQLDYDKYQEYQELYDMEEKWEWEEWYEQYVCDEYLSVPASMTELKELAEDLKFNSGLRALEGVPGENSLRVKAARVIVDWMARNMIYTQEPPALPRNADPVEYFVTESNEGYCMHYASAATLILREMGVPARYVSGYYVSTSDFKIVDGEIVGTVMDNAAHAWVEIYIDTVGWVPLEVTTSYADGINPNAVPSDDDKDSDEKDTSKDSEIGDVNEESTNETTSSMNETASTNTSTVEGKEENTTKGAGYYGTNNAALKKSIVGKVLLASTFAIVIPLIIYGVMRYYRFKEEKLRILIKKKRKSRAIRMINRNLYIKLKKKGKLIGSKHSDDAYKEALMKAYPEISEEEWNKYMDIVKEMAFSNNDGDEESMEYCYEIYKRVRDKRRK